jgi:uncharacterized protein
VALENKVHAVESQLQARKNDEEAGRAKIKALQEEQAALKKAGDAKLKSRGSLELEVKTRQEAVKKYNGQLLELKSNEAYAAMLSEIKKAQEEITAYEDKILALMETEEADKRKSAEDGGRITAEIKAGEAALAQAAEKTKVLEGQAGEVGAKREALVAGLWRDLVPIYLRLAKAVKGSPVAQIVEGSCNGCRMKIPPHQINEIRKAKAITYCQHCGRILIYPKS